MTKYTDEEIEKHIAVAREAHGSLIIHDLHMIILQLQEGLDTSKNLKEFYEKQFHGMVEGYNRSQAELKVRVEALESIENNKLLFDPPVGTVAKRAWKRREW